MQTLKWTLPFKAKGKDQRVRVAYKDGSHYHCRHKLILILWRLGIKRIEETSPCCVRKQYVSADCLLSVRKMIPSKSVAILGIPHIYSARCRMAYGIDKQEDHVAKAETYKTAALNF